MIRFVRTAIALPLQAALWLDDLRPREPSVDLRAANIQVFTAPRTSVRRRTA